MFMYIVGNFPASFMIQKLGTYYPICIGVTLNLIGAWLKCLINYSFY